MTTKCAPCNLMFVTSTRGKLHLCALAVKISAIDANLTSLANAKCTRASTKLFYDFLHAKLMHDYNEIDSLSNRIFCNQICNDNVAKKKKRFENTC